jgi:hypothetical protein
MDDSISSVTASISRLATYILGVQSDMNTLRNRLLAQIQQLMNMVQDLRKPDLPRKQQRPPPRTSPTGLTLQDIQVMTSDPPQGILYLNRSNSPNLSTALSTTQGKLSWVDKHKDDDGDMETVDGNCGVWRR